MVFVGVVTNQYGPTLDGIPPAIVGYMRVNGNGSTTDLGTAPPTDVGNYRVMAAFPATAFSLLTQATFDFSIVRAASTTRRGASITPHQPGQWHRAVARAVP